MQNYRMTPADRTAAPPASSVVLQVWGPPPKRRPLAAAMSWLASCFIDGFAAYGEMICPCLIDLPPDEDQGRPASAVPWPLSHQPQADETSLPRTAPPPAREGIAARLARWLTWFRPQREQSPRTYRRETLDDRTLRDIGMPPYYPDELERYLERYVDHGGW